MNSFSKEKFKEYLSRNLQEEAQKFQSSNLPSLDQEYEMAAKKLAKGKGKGFQRLGSFNEGPKNLQYIDKLQSILDTDNGENLKDLKVLNELAGYNKEARIELSNLKEATYAAESLKFKKTNEQIASANAKSDFDNYQKVQRIVDKVIIDTVDDLQKDLTLLPEKQKGHHIIDHLSGVHFPRGRKGSGGLKLPTLGETKSQKLKQITTPQPKHERVASHSITIGTMGTLGSSVLSNETNYKEKIISGFFRKEKKQKHKVDKEKEQIRKDCVELFVKRHVKVKSISDQYLFNLTQHNGNNYDPFSCRDSESSFSLQKNRSNNRLNPKSFYGAESARMIGSSYNGVEMNSPMEVPTCLNNKGSMSVRMLEKNSPRKTHKKVNSLSKIKLEKLQSGRDDGLYQSKNDLLMQEGGLGKALGLKDQFIFEGMGLLTMHTGYNHATRNVADYMPDNINMNIKTLKRSDVDYVQKRTGVNLRHCLYDRTIAEKDSLRFEYSDLQNLL